MTRGRKLAAALAGTAALGAIALSAAQALASPPSQVTGSVLAQGVIDEKININPARNDASIVTVQKVTIGPGGTTGWHSHNADVLAVVVAGTLTLFEHDCSARTISTGQGFVETYGHIHEARNLGATTVEVMVTYVSKPGDLLRVDEVDHGCSTS